MQENRNTTSITVRLDAELKHQVERLCDDLGMNMTTAVTMFLKTMVRERGLPFDARIDPFYSAANMAELKRRVADMDAGRNMVAHDLIELDDDEDEDDE